MFISGSRLFTFLALLGLFGIYTLTAPQNHSEAEDVYDFALKVEQGTFAEQTGVNRVLALPVFGVAYKTAQSLGYTGRAFPFMIFLNRLLAVGCLLLFYRLLSYRRHPAGSASYRGRPACLSSDPAPPMGIEANAPPDKKRQRSDARRPAPTASLFSVFSLPSSVPTLGTLCLAFSYGFWRYANEAETYILASVFVLGAWNLVLSSSSMVRGKPNSVHRLLSSVLCPLISALGILVHLLNLIPLLLIIPLYYLLSRAWKKALLHGALTGLLVVAGYAVCSPWLNFHELGARHHSLEAGLSMGNLYRGAIAFGQCLVSGNFLFGFEGFRELLVQLFPSRMLGEEFFMAQQMPGWIKWAGVATLSLFGVWGLTLCFCHYAPASLRVWFGVNILKPIILRRWTDGVLGRGDSPKCPVVDSASAGNSQVLPNAQCPVPSALTLSSLIWLILYAVAVVRTEAGSPELWIMALIPFWLIADPLLQGAMRAEQKLKAVSCLLIACLFVHNLVAGLLPVMPASTDYHQAKGKWLVDHANADDLILTDYEPVMVFYLNYFTEAAVLNSGQKSLNQIEEALGNRQGNAYALNNFFNPMESMRVRSPSAYAAMKAIGQALFPEFGKIVDDEFGGIWELKRSVPVER